jgi:hypothetical protein
MDLFINNFVYAWNEVFVFIIMLSFVGGFGGMSFEFVGYAASCGVFI